MNRAALREIVIELEAVAFGLELRIIKDGHKPERLDAYRAELEAALDKAQHRLRDAPRETAGNLFKADRTGEQMLCVACHRYWAPAGEENCDRCTGARPEELMPREYIPEERGVAQREIEAITQRPHHIPSGKDEP